MRASSTVRWSRASLLAAVVLAAGVVAHSSAGGLLPGAVPMVLLYGGVLLGCAALLGHEASALRLVAIMVAGQGLVHTALAATAGHRGEGSGMTMPSTPTAPVAPWDPRSGESYDQWASHAYGGQQGQGLAIPSWLTHALSDMVAHPGMAIAHVAAAGVVGLWLALGERALWLLLRIARNGVQELAARAGDRFAELPVLTLATLRPQPRRESFLEQLPALPVWSRGPVRRGPPLLFLAR